jgi:hypothetical protein
MRPFVPSLFLLALTVVPASAVDYAQIDRTLAKEPAYQSKSPEYALLLFGPEAKLRVWVVLDGETLFVDRNGDGDLTGKDKSFPVLSCGNIALADPDAKTRYVITAVGRFTEGKPPRTHLDVNVDVKGPVEYRQYCGVELRASPREAAMAHFHGPLTAGPRTINWKVPASLVLETGDKPIDLNALVGTMSADHGCWTVVRSHKAEKSAFAEGVCPVVDIEFPSKTPGGPPVKKRYLLDKFC